MFKRKAYSRLLEWKRDYSEKYACLLEGARRVGKTTIAEEFAKNEYKTYIKVDFANVTDEIMDVFQDIAKLDIFFLRLQAETGITLYERNSVLIFDEIQLYPKARQAIKYLVKDGRYDYIETGSLISIKKNVKDILIPSEEYKIQVYPMDYEEFLWATDGNADLLRTINEKKIPMGDATNRSLMRNFRIYMAVGGMPQAVEAYMEKRNFDYIDQVKRGIIHLYIDDLKKIDDSGRLSDIYNSIPSQLALKKKRFVISAATGKQKTRKDEERLFDLIDSRIVLPCYNVAKPEISLSQTKMKDKFKLYLSDVGLFTTMLFNDSENRKEDIYRKLLSDRIDTDLGYLYENAVAQIIAGHNRELYYHTWSKKESSHYYEIDFLLSVKNKIIPLEVKSASIKRYESMDEFAVKYSKQIGDRYLICQKDFSSDQMLKIRPLYLLPFVLDDYDAG